MNALTSETVHALPQPSGYVSNQYRDAANRLPSLDGLRALAIGLVIFGHFGAALPGGKAWPLLVLENGSLGVSIFFCISGFLITYLLLQEADRHGKISLSEFYFRRTLRIFPAFYLFLIVVAVVNRPLSLHISRNEFLSAAAYVWNYSPASHSWWLGHAWSLSVEEQFYLLWPAVLAMSGRKRAIRIASAIILASPFIRVANYMLIPEWRGRIPTMLHTRLDGLMVGALLALLWNSRQSRRWITRFYRREILLGAGFFLFVISPGLAGRFRGAYEISVGLSLDAITIAFLISWLVSEYSPLRRVLNTRPLVWIGTISYSLYLWQQLFAPANKSFAGRFPWNCAALCGCACFSYFVVERPLLRWRDRVMRFRWPRQARSAELRLRLRPKWRSRHDRINLSRPEQDADPPFGLYQSVRSTDESRSG